MNRKERRKERALTRNVKLPPARPDGRPLFYDLQLAPSEDNPTGKVGCYRCTERGLRGILYGQGEAFIADPANSPSGHHGDLLTVCKAHLPENAVIYNPGTNLCRNKSGDNTWMEDARDGDPNRKIAQKAGVKLPDS